MMRIGAVLLSTAAGLALAGVALVLLPVGYLERARIQPEATGADEAPTPHRPVAEFGDGRLLRLEALSQAPAMVEPTAPQEVLLLPIPSLLGIVQQDEELTAWLAPDGEASRAVVLGEEIGGWRVVEMSETRLLLEADDRREVLNLFEGP